MKHYAAVTVLALLIASTFPLQRSLAQAGAQKASTPAQYALEEEEILKLYKGAGRSERGARWEAQNYAMPRPVFPEDALKEGARGAVVLSFYIHKEKAALIKVVESPHPALTRAAIEAVRQWRWLPFIVGGKPYPILSKLTFNFVTEGGEGRVEDPEELDSPAFSNWAFPIELRKKAVWPEEVTSATR